MESDQTDASKDDSHDESSSARPVPAELQFSLKSLFIVTTFLSIAMALGTGFLGVALALLVIVLVQVATLLLADWLIRPANRRILAFVTAGSWIIFGSGMLIVAARFALDPAQREQLGDMVWPISTFFAIGAAFCYWCGQIRWRQLNAYQQKNGTIEQ
jgi:hypothetical protein